MKSRNNKICINKYIRTGWPWERQQLNSCGDLTDTSMTMTSAADFSTDLINRSDQCSSKYRGWVPPADSKLSFGNPFFIDSGVQSILINLHRPIIRWFWTNIDATMQRRKGMPGINYTECRRRKMYGRHGIPGIVHQVRYVIYYVSKIIICTNVYMYEQNQL